MAYAQPPPIAAMSPFWSLAYRFERIGYEFKGIYEKIEDVWLLGKYLRWPFYFIQYAFFTARDLSFDANIWVRKTKASIDALYEGWKFTEILDGISYHFQWIRQDSIGWLRHYISKINIDLAQLVTNATIWFRTMFYIQYPELWRLWNNSSSWLYDLLSYLLPYSFGFLINPYAKLTDWIIAWFPALRQLIQNPNAYVINLIGDWIGWFIGFLYHPTSTIVSFLKTFSYDLRALIDNPTWWFESKLAVLLKCSVGELYNLPVTLLRKIFSAILGNQLGILDTVRNAVCDIILRFI